MIFDSPFPTKTWRSALFALSFVFSTHASAFAVDTEVVVYGATPAGIAAAEAAGADGEQVLLIEPTPRIGGLVTSGLSHTDIRTFEGITGFYLRFTRHVEAYYAEKYGKDSAQVKSCERGIFAEPSVNLLVFEAMLRSHANIRVVTNTRLTGVRKGTDKSARKIEAIEVVDEKGTKSLITGKVFIDATYEGDLMAASNVPWRAGREARAEYGESLAPEHADEQLQAYNFRFIMTKTPAIV